MFNLNIAQPNGPEARKTRLPERLFGKLVGFVAGLVLIAAIDALFWNNMLWRAVAEYVAPSQPSLLHAVAHVGLQLTAR